MEGALQSAEAAHALFRSSTDKTAQMKAIYNVTRLQTDLGRYQQAAALLLEALKAASEAKEGEQEFRATRGLGFVYEIARDHQQALARYSEALALARTLGRKGEEAEMLLAVGRMNGKLGATQLGKEQMSQALKLFEAMEDDYYGKRFAHRSLALLFAGMRDLPNSIRQFELAKGGAQANYVFGAEKFVGLSALEVFAWAAALELRETDYRLNQSQLGADSALKKLERARMLYTNLDDLQGRIDTGLQISLLEAKLGAFEKSAAAANEALALSRQFPGLDNEASALLQLGALHAQLTQFPNAIESFEKALEHGRTQNSKSVIAKALSGIATVYSSLGEKELALRKVDEALNALGYAADLSNVKGSANVDVLMDIALVVHASEKDDKRAADFYLKIVELTEPSDGHLGDEHKEARARTRLADIIAARLKDKLDFALGTAEEALSIRRNLGDRAGEADTLNTIGLIETKLGKSKNAVAAYGRALAIFRTIKDTNGEGEVLGRLRDLSAAAGDRDLAIYFGKQSVDALQELRSRLQTLDIAAQKSYLRRVEGAFRSLAELLIGQGRLSEGLQVLRAFQDQGAFDADHSRPRTELWKNARELRLSGRYRDAFGVFAKTFVASPNSATRVSPTSNDSKEAKVPIGTLEEPLIKLFQDAKLEFSKSDADSQPPETLPELIALQKSISLLSQSSGENAVAVFQLAGAEALHVLIVTSKDIDCVSYAIPRDHLFAKAQQFWALLSSDKFDPTILGGELHEIIFRPIAGKIPKDTNTILWSLDGSLRYVPMGALYDGKSKQYLIERFNHVNLTRSDTERLTRPPAAKWTATAMGTSKPHRVSLFGDSILFNALPGVASEFEQLFGGIAGAKVLDGKVMRDGEFDRK